MLYVSPSPGRPSARRIGTEAAPSLHPALLLVGNRNQMGFSRIGMLLERIQNDGYST